VFSTNFKEGAFIYAVACYALLERSRREKSDEKTPCGLRACMFFLICSLFNDAFSGSQTIYSVDFYQILIRLPSSGEAGETQVRNMAAEFCRRAPIVLVGFFNMP
jgi:hypothetical protein